MPRPDLTKARWRKSSRSGNTNNACVEVAFLSDATAVRDSKNATGPALMFAPEQWSTFLVGLKSGKFES